MKRFVLLFLVFVVSFSMSSQGIIGKWKTIDGVSGVDKSIVEIYKENGKLFGKIIDILDPNDKDALCKKCKDDDYNKPVLGLVLIKNMQKDGDYYRKGTIFDPEHGKTFRCRLKLTDNPDVLQVRGYIAFLYATQYWERVK
ncbi:MAG: DUF2147 domain-containing protein [Bacteroidetes bacterium]|nr:DUF2147 domain-containing protein [Bacteroidota bacterium]